MQQIEKIRRDICEFKAANGLDKVIVLWTANTERMCNIQSYHKTAEELLQAIEV
jgi:myo-inositol-1-phosphate synthase